MPDLTFAELSQQIQSHFVTALNAVSVPTHHEEHLDRAREYSPTFPDQPRRAPDLT